MPHVFALVIAGAGLYAGLKWVSRLVSGAADEATGMKSAPRPAPKDLGTLDLDPQSGVYRPRTK
jgi:hypothetical protein